MGVSTAAGVTDGAATQDPTLPQPALGQPAYAPRGPPAGQRSPGSLSTLCNHTRSRFSGRQKAGLRSRMRAKRSTEIEMKPNRLHTHTLHCSLFPLTHPGLATRRPRASATPAPRGSSTASVVTLISQLRSPSAAHAAKGLATSGSSREPLLDQST
jgi:hypothetical protein